MGGVQGSRLCLGNLFCMMHSSLTLCMSSLSVIPGESWSFCARVMGEQHFMSSGHMISTMSASKSSSTASSRYTRWLSDRGFWCGTFLGNVVSAGMLIQCLVPGMRMTSLMDRVKQLANLVRRDVISLHCSGEMSEPILTSLNISATHLGLHGSVFLVNRDCFTLASVSGCGSSFTWGGVTPTDHTAFQNASPHPVSFMSFFLFLFLDHLPHLPFLLCLDLPWFVVGGFGGRL